MGNNSSKVKNGRDNSTKVKNVAKVTNGSTHVNDVSNSVSHVETPFTIHNTVIENPRRLRVVVIGAGFSGILAAIRIPEKLRNIDLTVYEQSTGVGGVWWLNRYPGVACDIPSHSYQYSFAPNPHWSDLYAPGKEIQAYLQDVAERYGAVRFIKLQHKVQKAVWDTEAKKWKVSVERVDTGETFEDVADFVVTAKGQLNDVSWPDIPGLSKFQGKILHSAEWEEGFDFRNKKVAIIGNGSSAIQIIPSLQRVENISITCFMRSPTWISSSFGDAGMLQLGFDPEKTEFTPEQRQKFASDPETYFKVRKAFEDGGNMIHDSTIPGTRMQREFTAFFRDGMEKKLVKKPELLETIIPTFAPGCRRLTPGKGFLEALTEDNVEVVNEAVAEITEAGVRLASGRRVEVDAIVCATGFKIAEAPNFAVVGKNGLTLAERWTPRQESYLSVAVDGFPNYLMVFGPNSAIGFGSLTKILESETDYVVKVLRKMQKEDYATIEPRPERVADFTKYVGEYFKETVYMDKCKSWYRSEGGRGDWISGLWPGSTLHGLEALRSPRWEDFLFESSDPTGNSFGWLGNGWSLCETQGDPSWYINPDEVEVPLEGKPEAAKRYVARLWSY